MAIKYSKRTKHNAGTKRTSYNNKTGNTRTTVTVKTGNYTRSQSRNANGSLRQTTTHKAPNGFITRTTKTIGKPKISKPRAPAKPKQYKSPKPKASRSASSSTPKSWSSPSPSRRNRRSSGESGDGKFLRNFYLIVFFIIVVYWIF